MSDTTKRKFSECIDLVQAIIKPARTGLGEDSLYCASNRNGHSAIVSVFDGCGGLGARTYESLDGHTGAYIASRVVSGAVHDWYHENQQKKWKSSDTMTASMDNIIRNAYQVCEPYAKERLRIKGSMVRKLPTTMALAYAEPDEKGICIHVLWAGDSRVYLLNADGLAQLTIDDTDVEDALENLTADGAMNNVLSSDGNYVIHHRTLYLNAPAIIFAATDGCFGYIPSPMEFEYEILRAIMNGRTPENFSESLRTELGEYAGDDLSMGLMSFFFGSFQNMQSVLENRFRHLETEYIQVLEAEESEECLHRLWKAYKPTYERYLRGMSNE